ncbi:MAG: peptidyl-prolyl cis-trans isomerase [Saprospiraceae bacterium]|nr:MAG: peptidyl-prolyl cis-trans isomerase [Saprospiraceae bacterium]
MFKQILILLIAVMGILSTAMAQEDNRELFSVEGNPVSVSEFVYIYSKTNGKTADFSKPSLEEYLDLYVKFKLKVQKAKDMQLDTIKQLQEELAGYRRQLADSYLIDKSLTDQLVKEAYDRIQQDVDISHILIALNPDPTPEDTLAAFQKAESALKRIEGGVAFSAVAKEVSMDKSVQRNEGHVGFVTALFPKGFYNLESAAYSAPLNKLVGPVRTDAGYHILMVNARRPARGELEAAHILVRKNEKNPEAAKAKVDSIYLLLKSGIDFEEAAKQFSDDGRTAAKGGYIGFFGINRYEKPFEEAAFALKADDSFSEPFQTSAGWHIVRRISHKGIQPFNIEKSRLDGKIRKDPRFEASRLKMLEQIKNKSDFKENPAVLDAFISTLTDTFLTFRWKAPKEKSTEALFSLGSSYKVTLGDFTDYLGSASRQRLKMGRGGSLDDATHKLYADFVNDQILKYEESQLENKYPEFKSLMREYEEGILLFEATKRLVWDKASQDTTGLEQFFEKNLKGKYIWKERAETSVYRVPGKYRTEAQAIYLYSKKRNAEDVKAKFNTDSTTLVTVETTNYEKDRNPEMKDMEWEVGAMSRMEELPRGNAIKFYKIENILPAGPKTLKEARGYAVADYQDQLEREWIELLRKEYKVKINKPVFESLIKK